MNPRRPASRAMAVQSTTPMWTTDSGSLMTSIRSPHSGWFPL